MSTKIGIQLYTVRGHAAADPEGTIRKIAELGYAGVQFAGYYGFPAKELNALLADTGLQAAGSHVGFDLLEKNAEGEFDFADELGLKSITIPWIGPDTLTLPQTIEKVARFSEVAARHGISLSYHNHHHEFVVQDGTYPLDAFYKKLPDMRVELDTYWAQFAGADPLAYMERYAGRLSSIHIKDMKPDAAEGTPNANIGEGILNIAGYIKKAETCGAKWAFVEMDACDGDELACAGISRRNLRDMGW